MNDSSWETYPSGQWGSRPAPTGQEIDTALTKAHQWWRFATYRNSDDCLKSFVDLFERYLGEKVRHRPETLGEQATLERVERESETKISAGTVLKLSSRAPTN